jgi:hydroxymethylpyrimidine pyrophosphatase-like HAD family hydrolase
VRALVLVDLDDTLFQTRRKCPPDVPDAALTALGFGKDGDPLGFATPRQTAFLNWLSEAAMVVPVTGRSLGALRRVRLDHRVAICAHGGVMLGDDGEPDPDWERHIAAEAAPHAKTLAMLAAAGGPLARILAEGETALYVLLKHPDADEDALDEAVARVLPLVPAGWTIHRNGNNAALMPPFLGKAQAVRALLPGLRARHPDAPVIGIGDSLSDAPFMGLCDYAMMPTGSQLGAAALAGLA